MLYRTRAFFLSLVLFFLLLSAVSSLLCPSSRHGPCQVYLRRFSTLGTRESNFDRKHIILNARVAKKEDDGGVTVSQEGGGPQSGGSSDGDAEDDGDFITIPFQGLMGPNNSPFTKMIERYDPLKNIDDLPGEPDSDERFEALTKRIEERVAMMKASGEWNEEISGKDPLAGIPLWQSVIMEIKTVRPYASPSEFFLDYSLLMFTLLFLSGFMYASRNASEQFMEWFLATDFDAEFVSNIPSMIGGMIPHF